MLVRRFLAWSESAPAGLRADGARALARAALNGDMAEEDAQEAFVALTALLDDPSPLVRRAMAEVMARAPNAPHHIVASLATDQSDVASIVLAHAPVLSDAELIDGAAIGDVFAQCAIAIRLDLSAPVAAALAEVGVREAAIALLVNPSADVADFSLRRILERLGDDGEVREAILSRRGLPLDIRHDVMTRTAAALSAFVTARGWLSDARAQRVTSDSCERATVAMAADAPDVGAQTLVAHLRASGALTAGLILRSILSGEIRLLEAALVELSRLKPLKVAGLVREFRGAGFAALYGKCGLPTSLLPLFRQALAAARARASSEAANGRLSRELVASVLRGYAPGAEGQHRVIALLRRYEAEAAREDARERVSEMLQLQPSDFVPEQPPTLSHEPDELLLQQHAA